ncbi:MAG: substrate-binding domain-containing protein [Myxococcales bacterium]|nr:MAG: substrate-binding domain-containing protein [Myxococcales bacterium]
MRFLLTSQECELLLRFEENSSLVELAKALHKDVSVVSRNLKAISHKFDVLKKHQGRWILTEKGKSINAWSKEAIFSQQLSLGQQKNIRIATTREFASRILLPKIKMLIGEQDISVSIVTSDSGIENYILSGKADFGFDCGRPQSPGVAFKRLVRERFAIVASPNFTKKYSIKHFDDLDDKNHLKFMRAEGAVLDLDVNTTQYFGTFGDISNLRQACVLGYGWAVMPYYMVKKEIEEGALIEITGTHFPDQKFGVWWQRDRASIIPWIHRASEWLSKQNLC